MKNAIIGTKLGMTQTFDENGLVVPVTVVQAGPCSVIQKKTADKDGYDAIKIAYLDVRESLKNKPEMGEFKKAGVSAKKHLVEFKLEDLSAYNVGDEFKCDVFNEGDIVDVTGTTRGRGYTGAIQRWNYGRHRMSHGNGPNHRHLGSVGAGTTPGRVLKGKKMAGQYGNETVTIQNLKVVKVDTERNVILVSGAIPGPKGSLVTIKSAVKG